MGIKTGKKALFTEINITPLTDIFLVLLIIMMVVAPTFQSVDNSISVPEVNSGTAIEQGKVTVSVNGVIFISLKLSRIIHSNCHIDYLEAEVLYLYFALPQVSSGLFY